MIRRAFARAMSGGKRLLGLRGPEPLIATQWIVTVADPTFAATIALPNGADLSTFGANLDENTPYTARLVEHYEDGGRFEHPAFTFRFDAEGNIVPVFKVER